MRAVGAAGGGSSVQCLVRINERESGRYYALRKLLLLVQAGPPRAMPSPLNSEQEKEQARVQVSTVTWQTCALNVYSCSRLSSAGRYHFTSV